LVLMELGADLVGVGKAAALAEEVAQVFEGW
jgi:hypothetical protein